MSRFLIYFKLLLSVSVAVMAAEPPPIPATEETQVFENEMVKDFKLKEIKTLRITNRRGKISLQSWPQEKMRVVATQKVTATTRDLATQALKTMDVELLEHENSLELLSVYGKGLPLQQKIAERKKSASSMDIVVFAPPRIPVLILSDQETVEVKRWLARVEVRSIQGSISLSNIESSEVVSVCKSCEMDLSEIRADLRLRVEEGKITLNKITASRVFLESQKGKIQIRGVEAHQTWFLGQTEVLASDISGRVEFRASQSDLKIMGLKGWVSGKNDLGSTLIDAKRWDRSEKALIESDAGDIVFRVSKEVKAVLDLDASEDKLNVGFQLEPENPSITRDWPKIINRESRSVLRGRPYASHLNQEIRISSKLGKVSIEKAK